MPCGFGYATFSQLMAILGRQTFNFNRPGNAIPSSRTTKEVNKDILQIKIIVFVTNGHGPQLTVRQIL